MKQISKRLENNLYSQLSPQLWDSLVASSSPTLRRHLYFQLWDRLYGQLRDEMRSQVHAQVWSHLAGKKVLTLDRKIL